jgi:hypothetical protein
MPDSNYNWMNVGCHVTTSDDQAWAFEMGVEDNSHLKKGKTNSPEEQRLDNVGI